MRNQEGKTVIVVLLAIAVIIFGVWFSFFRPIDSSETNNDNQTLPAVQNQNSSLVNRNDNEEEEKKETEEPGLLEPVEVEEDSKDEDAEEVEDDDVEEADSLNENEGNASDDAQDDIASEEPIDPGQVAPTGNTVEVTIEAKQFEYSPSTITAKKGDTVRLTIKSADVQHGFTIPHYNISATVAGGESTTVEFTATTSGNFPFFNNVYSGSGTGRMRGVLIVEE